MSVATRHRCEGGPGGRSPMPWSHQEEPSALCAGVGGRSAGQVRVNALRALTNGGPTATLTLQSLPRIGGILVAFVPLAVRRYRDIS